MNETLKWLVPVFFFEALAFRNLKSML